MSDFHRGPWLVDDRPSVGAGFTVRPRDPKNPASFRTFNDRDGEFARRIVRALDAAPELLESLKELESEYGDFKPGAPFDFPEDHPHARARAAIARAESGAA